MLILCATQLFSLAVCVEGGGSSCIQTLRQGKCNAGTQTNLRTVSECVYCSSRLTEHKNGICSASQISRFCFPAFQDQLGFREAVEEVEQYPAISCSYQLGFSSCKADGGGFKEEVEQYDQTHPNGNAKLLQTYKQLEKINELTHKDSSKLKHEIVVLKATQQHTGCIQCVQEHMLVLKKILLRVFESGGSGSICTSSDVKAFCAPQPTIGADHENEREVQRAIPVLRAAGRLLPPSAAQLDGKGAIVSKSCKQELTASACDVDEVKNDGAKCMVSAFLVIRTW